jgi:hypothetical protein
MGPKKFDVADLRLRETGVMSPPARVSRSWPQQSPRERLQRGVFTTAIVIGCAVLVLSFLT